MKDCDAGVLQVAKLASLNGTSVDESKPFAELWYGCSKICMQSGLSQQLTVDNHVYP